MKTKRLIIRLPQVKDLDEILLINNSEYVLKYNAMPMLSKEQMHTMIENSIKEASIFYIELQATSQIIGAIFVENDNLRFKVNSVCLSYYLGENFANNGYMTEALNAIIEYLFSEKQVDVISARAFAENIASINLLKKIGFKQEGYLRHCVRGYNDIIHDDIVFSMLKADYNINKGVNKYASS